ncbi:MAG: carbohydrate-binding domain-containing protein [Christensenellales bacterium]
MVKKELVLITVVLTVLSLVALCGCNFSGDKSQNGAMTIDDISFPSGSEMFTDSDKDASYDSSDACCVTLSGDTATATDSGVTISDRTVTINSSGTYIVKGNGTNKTIVIDAENEKVKLVLSSVTVTNDDFAALYIKNADKVFIVIEGDNSLSVTGDFVAIDENSVDGVIFSKADFVLQGNGSLDVNSSKHGIVGKDDVKITGATVTVVATSKGIDANDSVRIAEIDLNITSGKDCIHVENTDNAEKGYIYIESGSVTVVSANDGMDASSTVQIVGGEIDVTSGGGSSKTVSSDVSAKGIKVQSGLKISGGKISVNSADDCIHCNGVIEISGGEFSLYSGDDGIHADSSLIVSGGKVTVSKSYEGLEAQNVVISGGIVSIAASDDGINAAGGNDGSSIGGRPGQNPFNTASDASIVISGGDIYVNASGDGIDSNGSVTVSGGTVIVEGPTDSGNGAFDYDGTATISGGVFIAIGSSGMAMNFSTATQGSILFSVSSQSAGTEICLKDSSDNVLYSMTASKAYSSVLISMPDVEKGGSYTLTAGSASKTVTLTAYIYGSSSGMGGAQPGRPW